MLFENRLPPFEVINPAGSAPILLACDHAENRIPECLGNLGLQDEQLQTHIAYDIGARQVSIRLSELFDAPLILAGYSRLVIDLNRHLHDPTLIPGESDHVFISGNQGLDDMDKQQRIDQVFHPYHNQYSELVSALIEKHEKSIIFSVHSFTPSMDGVERPWDFGVLWDQDEVLAKRLIAAFSKLPGRTIGDNQPYHARHPQGYAQTVHARERDIEMVLLEIRQDLIACVADQMSVASLVYGVVQSVLSQHLSQYHGRET